MRKIKFPLILKNISCNTLNEVKQNFDIEEMIGYFHDKRLLKWLKDRSLEKELISVEKLSIDDPKFPTKSGQIEYIVVTNNHLIQDSSLFSRSLSQVVTNLVATIN